MKSIIQSQLFLHLLLLFSVVLLASCQQAPNGPAGHYEGTLYSKKNGEFTSYPIGIDVANGLSHIDVSDEEGNTLYSFKSSNVSNLGLTISLPDPWKSANLAQQSGCYVQKSHTGVQLCFTGGKILLEISDNAGLPVFTISGDQFNKQSPFAMEDPANYSIQQAIQIALGKNFDSRIQFEQLIQAKQQSRAAYENLLPHLNLSDALANLTPNLLSILGCVGDLAPFLLPNRWLQAQETQEQAQAQQDTLNLMHADLGAEVEGMAYALAGDEMTLNSISKLLQEAILAQTQVEELEAAGTFSPGTTDNMKVIVDQMTLDVAGLQLLVTQDKQNLAGAMGFHNPDAIRDLSLDSNELLITSAKPIDQSTILPVALNRAFELSQVDHLVEVANNQTKENYFSWLDPQASPSMDLGFSTGENINISKDNVAMLLTRREQLQAAIATKVDTYADQWNESLKAWPIIQDNLLANQRRWQRQVAQLTPNSGLSTFDTEAVLQDYEASLFRQASILTNFRVARSMIDRLQLQGFYSTIQSVTVPANKLK